MRTKRLLSVFVLAVLASTVMMAQSIVGKWTIDNPEGMQLPEGATATFNFQQNKICAVTLDMTANEPISDGINMNIKIAVSVYFNYAVSGDNLTMSDAGLSPKVNKFEYSFPGMDASQQAAMKQIIDPQMGALKQQMINEIKGYDLGFGSATYSITGNKLSIDNYTFTKVASSTSTTARKTTTKKKK